MPGQPAPPAAAPQLHAPPEQAPLGQAVPHPPQLLWSVCVSTQVLPQRVCPLGQPVIHRPETQTAPEGQSLDATQVHAPPEQTPLGQATLQAPQLLASLKVLMQVPPQSVVPVGQEVTQTPPKQNWPVGQPIPPPQVQMPAVQLWLGQTVPQTPQLFESVWRLVQVLPQRVWPAGQGVRQRPPTHSRPAGQGAVSLQVHAPPTQSRLGQMVPQAPQLLASLLGSEHWPAQQFSPPQDMPQVPQLVLSVAVLVHVPPQHCGLSAPQGLVQLPQCSGSERRSKQATSPQQV